MRNWQEELKLLKSREASDEVSILDTITLITATIDTIRAEESKLGIERIVIELILLNKHPCSSVKAAAVACLTVNFREETRAIEQQVIALRKKKELPSR